MHGGAANLAVRVEFHDLDRLTLFDGVVVQGDRCDAAERDDGLKMQRGIAGKTPLEVGAQRVPAGELSLGSASESGEGRDELNVLAVVRQDPIEIVSVPCFDPFVFKFGYRGW